MKKIILMLLALVLALGSLSVFAEEEAAIPSPEAEDNEIILIDGFVMEVLDSSILFQASFGETYEVLLSEETILEGKELAVGDYISVAYDGTMTFSIPAQIRAQHIGNHMLMGLVSERTENSFLLTFGEEVHQVNANAALLEGIQDGMFVTVYHAGMMTMSLPAQVIALHIRGEEIVGTVTEMVEGGFTLTVEGEELPYHVAIKEDAVQFVQAEPGIEVIVVTDGLMTASLESILVNAVEILPLAYADQEVSFDLAGVVTEINDEYIVLDSTEGMPVQIDLVEDTVFEGKEIEVGDFVHITYNGQMTFSLPPQVVTWKIGCYAHTGVVGEITEGQFALETELELILVNATAEQLEGLEPGMTVTVYSNGAMTMSLPAQIGAEHIVATETIAD